MKQFFLILILMIISFVGNTQSATHISYILPDSVEIAAYKYIKSFPTNTSDNFYFLISKPSFDTAVVVVNRYHPYVSTLISKWVAGSNRTILVDTARYPVLLDWDFMFGTPQESNIGKMGSRDVDRILVLSHTCYTIIFKISTGKIIRTIQN